MHHAGSLSMQIIHTNVYTKKIHNDPGIIVLCTLYLDKNNITINYHLAGLVMQAFYGCVDAR